MTKLNDKLAPIVVGGGADDHIVVGRSPRAVKRFVNVYRLIRARIAPAELSEFIGTDNDPGAYQAVQFLLSVIVGLPAVSDELFAQLRSGNNSLLDIVRVHAKDEEIKTDKRLCWQTIQQFLEPEKGTSAFTTYDKVNSIWLDRVGRYFPSWAPLIQLFFSCRLDHLHTWVGRCFTMRGSSRLGRTTWTNDLCR